MDQQNNEQFTPAMIAGCEAALRAEMFYQDDFEKYVLQHMGGPDCKPVLVNVYSIDQNATDFPKTYVQFTRDIDAEIRQKPRGHYAIIERIGTTSRFSTVVSDGTGKVAVGGKFNSSDTQPTGDEVIKAMIGYEIYCCRKYAERLFAHQKDKEMMEQHQFQVGQQFKGLQSDEHYPKHKFGTTTIVEIRPDLRIRLQHTKRGSRNKWEGMVSPTLLAKMIGWANKVTSPTEDKKISVASMF